MMLSGVLAGATTPDVISTTSPGNPDAARVGKPGASADGCAVVTANALNLPDLTKGIAPVALGNDKSISPASSALTADPPLRYAIRTIRIPAMEFNNSPAT